MAQRTRPIGLVDNIDIPTDAVLSGLDQTAADGLDGAAGGTYTPTSPIYFGANSLELSGSANLALTSRALNHYIPLTSAQPDENGGRVFEWGSVSILRYAWEQAIDSTRLLTFHLDIPHGSSLTRVIATFKPTSGHTAFPVPAGEMPNLEAYEQDNNGNRVSLGNQDDTFVADAGTYEASHTIQLDIDQPVNRSSYVYVIDVRGESGTFYQSGLALTSLLAVCAITSYQEWA